MIETKTQLLEHQQQAYDKLIRLKVGALYMGMGTGKTRTAIELIKDRFNKGKINHVLWFCPCTVKENLKKDIEKHSEGLIENTSIIGIESISMSDRLYLEVLELVQKYKCYLIVDESNLVKNHFALRTKRIQALGEVCSYKLILNGTPITRNEADLYSQWYILDKRIFGYRSYWSFQNNHLELDKYGKIVDTKNVDYLTNKMSPYSFEISKDQCLDLPSKIYEDKWFDLTERQRWHYKEILGIMTERVDEWDSTTVYRLLHAMQLVVSGRYIYSTDKNILHRPMFANYKDNPRIELLEYVLEYIDEKVIIWCKYFFEIDEVKELLKELGLEYRELNGKQSEKEKIKSLYDFEHNADVKVLIGNKRTGGYGLNLQFCKQMIYYSSDFDWGTTIQSEDRIHRIGQEDKCVYTKLWADVGIDNMIRRNLDKKEDLERYIRMMLNEKNNIKELLL